MNANAPDIIQDYKDVFGELGCLKGDHHVKESNPTTLHCARLLLLLSGVSFQLIPNMGMNKDHVRDRKTVSSIVEVMEVSECEKDFHILDGYPSEDGHVEVNAYGTTMAALDRAQDRSRRRSTSRRR